MRVVQNDSWVIGEKLGAGGNCVVHAATNPFWPGAVLKKGPWHSIHEEAQLIWQVDHPTLVRVFCVLDTSEVDTAGEPLAYVAMERLGPSLAYLLTSNKQSSLCRRYANNIYPTSSRRYAVHVALFCCLVWLGGSSRATCYL